MIALLLLWAHVQMYVKYCLIYLEKVRAAHPLVNLLPDFILDQFEVPRAAHVHFLGLQHYLQFRADVPYTRRRIRMKEVREFSVRRVAGRHTLQGRSYYLYDCLLSVGEDSVLYLFRAGFGETEHVRALPGVEPGVSVVVRLQNTDLVAPAPRRKRWFNH